MILSAAASEGRVLVTLDTDFGDILQHPPAETPGIVVLRLHRQSLSLVRRAAMALASLLSREPIGGRLWVLDESRLRIWPDDGPT